MPSYKNLGGKSSPGAIFPSRNTGISITDTQLQEAWKAFARQKEAEGKMSLHALMTVILPKSENNEVQVYVENKLQYDKFDEVLENQIIYDYDTNTINSESNIQLNVNLPDQD